jgi:hypothetical protein
MPATLLLAPAHRPLARPLADQVDRVDPHVEAPYFVLTAALVQQAQADLAHRCSRSCEHRVMCAQRRASARLFLTDLRYDGRSVWAAWLHLAVERAGRSPVLSGPTWVAR